MDNIELIKHHQYDIYLLIWFKTKENTMWEGNHIFLFKNITLSNTKININDPYGKGKEYPIASFIPNIDGWSLGLKLIKQLTKG